MCWLLYSTELTYYALENFIDNNFVRYNSILCDTSTKNELLTRVLKLALNKNSRVENYRDSMTKNFLSIKSKHFFAYSNKARVFGSTKN